MSECGGVEVGGENAEDGRTVSSREGEAEVEISQAIRVPTLAILEHIFQSDPCARHFQ